MSCDRAARPFHRQPRDHPRPGNQNVAREALDDQGVARLCPRLQRAAPGGNGRPNLDRAFLSRRSGGPCRGSPPVLLLPPQRCRGISCRLGQGERGKTPLAPEMDAVLHEERLDRARKRAHAIPGPIGELPDGTVIAAVGAAYTIVQGRAFRWSEQGYQAARQLPRADALLTPPSTLLAIRAGYRPALHPDLEASPRVGADF